MKNINWSEFNRKIAVKKPVQELYNWWVTSGNLENFFLRRADFYDESGILRAKNETCQPGDTYEWEWYGYNVVEKGKVISLNGKDEFKFTFAGDCIVTVRFYEKDGYTVVEITQSNIKTDDEHKANIYVDCSIGWQFYLCNIKSIAEAGFDLRIKDPGYISLNSN